MAEPIFPTSTRQRTLRDAEVRTGESAVALEPTRQQQIRTLLKDIEQLKADEAREEAAEEQRQAGPPRERGRHRFQMRQSEPTLREASAQREFRAWDEPLPEPPAPFMRRIPTWLLWSFCLVFSAQFLAVGYYAHIYLDSRPPDAPIQTSPTEWTASLIRELEKVLADFAGGREAEARQATAQLLAKSPELPGLALLEAEAARTEGRLISVDVALAREIQRVTPFRYRALLEQARNYAAQNKLVEALASLRSAVALDPVRPEAHFYIGEIRRRMGRFFEAIACFESAANAARPGLQPDLALIRLRQRFARAESGRENTLAAETEAALARPDPEPEWLALDAALKLLAGNVAETRASLLRLKTSCPPARLAVLLDDHIFRSLLNRNELRDLLPKRDLRDRASASFLPPP